jgi:hypothetical protein
MPYTRKVRRVLKRCFREFIESKSYGDTADINAQYRRVLDRCWADGKIGIIRSGMDCDCTKYHHEEVIPMRNSVQALKRWDDHRQEWLDGPESVQFVRPDQIDRSNDYSRDLALEAYEDGHPHVVYA